MTAPKPKPQPRPWPKLSEQLTGPRAPDRCQSCGVGELIPDLGSLSRWRECDENDRPTGVVVVLCGRCAGRLVGPHPRLYAELDPLEPVPGSMALCLGCRHREGVRCAHPFAKANGGPGLDLVYPRPDMVHIRRSPRRLSGWSLIHRGPVVSCSGREEGGEG